MKNYNSFLSTQQLDSTLCASLLLFSRLTAKLQSDDAFYIDALKVALILIFCSLKSFISGNAENYEMVEARVKDTTSRLSQYLKDYIGRSKMMGSGDLFGGFRAQKAEVELKVGIVHIIRKW